MSNVTAIIRSATYVKVLDKRAHDPVSIYRVITKERAAQDVRVQFSPKRKDPGIAFFATSRLLSPAEPIHFTHKDLDSGTWTQAGLKLKGVTITFLDSQYHPITVPSMETMEF